MALLRSHLIKYILASVRRLLQLLQAPTLDRSAIADEALYLRLAIQFGPANLRVDSLIAPRWKVANPAKSNLGQGGNIVLAWDDPDLAEGLAQVAKTAAALPGQLNSPAFVAAAQQELQLFSKSARGTKKKPTPLPPPSGKRPSQPRSTTAARSGKSAKKRSRKPSAVVKPARGKHARANRKK